MKNIVFIDRIGEIFNGDVNSAKENYEKYKDLSMRGIGNFADKDVYLTDESGNIITSYGKSLFKMGGEIENVNNFIDDFIIGKKINNEKINNLGFTALQGNGDSVMIFKNKDGEYPIIKINGGIASFFKSNFTIDDFINGIEKVFKESCLKQAIQFKIQ